MPQMAHAGSMRGRRTHDRYRDVVSHPLLGDAHVIAQARRARSPRCRRSTGSARRGSRRSPSPAHCRRHRRRAPQRARRRAQPRASALRYAGPYPTPGAVPRAAAIVSHVRATRRRSRAIVLERAATLARDESRSTSARAAHAHRARARSRRGPRWPRARGRSMASRTSATGLARRRSWTASTPRSGSATSVWARVATFDRRPATLVDGPHRRSRRSHERRDRQAISAGAAASRSPSSSPSSRPARRRAPSSCRAVRWADLGARAARAHATTATRSTPRCGSDSRHTGWQALATRARRGARARRNRGAGPPAAREPCDERTCSLSCSCRPPPFADVNEMDNNEDARGRLREGRDRARQRQRRTRSR